jgi:hypothetical protein
MSKDYKFPETDLAIGLLIQCLAARVPADNVHKLIEKTDEVTDCKHLWSFTLEAGVCSETACRHCGVTLHEIP